MSETELQAVMNKKMMKEEAASGGQNRTQLLVYVGEEFTYETKRGNERRNDLEAYSRVL